MRILAAAQWAIYSAMPLLELMSKTSPEGDDVQRFKSHLFDDANVFSTERWCYWKQRFLIVADDVEYAEDVKAMASMALQSMGAAEKAHIK